MSSASWTCSPRCVGLVLCSRARGGLSDLVFSLFLSSHLFFAFFYLINVFHTILNILWCEREAPASDPGLWVEHALEPTLQCSMSPALSAGYSDIGEMENRHGDHVGLPDTDRRKIALTALARAVEPTLRWRVESLSSHPPIPHSVSHHLDLDVHLRT